MIVIGQKIKELRKKGQLTQKELAKILDIGKASLSHYEKGERAIPLEVLIKIANYFETDINYILGINNIIKSDKKVFYASDKEIKFLEEMRKISTYQNILISPKNYARLIERKTKDYKIKI